MLSLLFRIMCDPWWTRRWIFQEEYCASDKMHLLMPCDPILVNEAVLRIVGDVPGELHVKAVDFRDRVTSFCLASHDEKVFTSEWEKLRCQYVLTITKKYNVLQIYGWIVGDDSKGRAMSTQTLADISGRSAK